MRFKEGTPSIVMMCLFSLSTALQAQSDSQGLLRDGFLLKGVDGRVVYDPQAEGWYFQSRATLSDGRTVLPAGTRLKMLPTTALDSLQIDLKQPTRTDYRLWAKVTQYEGQNYIFAERYRPLGPSVPPPSPLPVAGAPRGPSDRPASKLGIPAAIEQRRAAKKRVERPSVASAEALKPNKLILDRVGHLKVKHEEITFELDGLGLQLQTRSLSLLPCRLLNQMQESQRRAQSPLYFRIAGLITEYQGQDYLMVQRAAQIHDYGNFGR